MLCVLRAFFASFAVYQHLTQSMLCVLRAFYVFFAVSEKLSKGAKKPEQ